MTVLSSRVIQASHTLSLRMDSMRRHTIEQFQTVCDGNPRHEHHILTNYSHQPWMSLSRHAVSAWNLCPESRRIFITHPIRSRRTTTYFKSMQIQEQRLRTI